MNKARRVLTFFVSLTLLVVLFVPIPASAANLYFTAINDSMPPLTSDTMPFWSGGSIYVPYTLFDPNLNGINVSLGLYTSFNRTSGTVTIFNLRQMLVFDLNNGTCQDDLTGTVYTSRSIMRNGRPYLSLDMVCTFFNLEYSYHQLPNISQGYLVRVKSADAVLSDARFIDAAQDLINKRLREYTQSLNPAEITEPSTPPTPVTPPPSNNPIPEENTATYLAFRCENGENIPNILSTLDSNRYCGVFFLTPQLIEEEGNLVRRILGTGHSVGILADNNDEDLFALLTRGNRALEEAAHTRTTLAYVSAGQRAGLEQMGWVCWDETLFLEPTDTVRATAFAHSVLSRLENRHRVVYLTFLESTDTARVLPTLLRQFSNNHYTIAIPVETNL